MRRPIEKKAICPTPSKIRYTSRQEAKKESKKQSLTAGINLHSYECVCGFWHMSKHARTEYQDPVPTVVGVPHALGLNDDEFNAFVMFDLHGKLSEEESAILRHPTVVRRWSTTLTEIRAEVQDDLRQLGDGSSGSIMRTERRNAKVRFMEHVQRHQQEAKNLVAELPPVVKEVVVSENKRLRRTAGERALESLVNRHRVEFTELFYREADAVGLTLTRTLDQMIENIGLEGLRELDVVKRHDPHTPRYPDVHIVLTGTEEFEEIVALTAGAIFRHLRDGDSDVRATYAVVDIVGMLHKMSVRNVTDAIYIARDWVTLHTPFTTE